MNEATVLQKFLGIFILIFYSKMYSGSHLNSYTGTISKAVRSSTFQRLFLQQILQLIFSRKSKGFKAIVFPITASLAMNLFLPQ